MKNTGKLLRLLVENKEIKRPREKYNFGIGIEILPNGTVAKKATD